LFKCPCCGYETLETRYNTDTCYLCIWENDLVGESCPEEIAGGPNSDYSLVEARENFKKYLIMFRPSDSNFKSFKNDKIDEYGEIISGFKQVSHCYRRVVYPYWQYSLYSMIHTKTKEKCENIISDIKRKINVIDYKPIYSLKEYKKERIKYFSNDQKDWEKRHLKNNNTL